MIEYPLPTDLETRFLAAGEPKDRITIEAQDKYFARISQASKVSRANDLVPVLHFEKEPELTMFLLKWSN